MFPVIEIEKIIGDNVRGFRERLGVSQEKLAEYADVHRTFIGTIERGEQNISVKSIVKMAEALKVAPYVLLVKNAFKEADLYQKK
jgi:transcriptional regulator with XRE-family HTH domain